VATLLGMALSAVLGWSLMTGIVFGLCLSTASTVVLLRALEERQLIDSQRGQIAIGWLIVEDLVMVLTLVLLPAVAGMIEKDNVGFASLALDMSITIGKVVAFIAIMMLVGRRLVPWIMSRSAATGSRELFTLSVLALALGIAFGAVELFDVSFALGAFFAGMVLNESELSHRAAHDTLPLRDAFAVLFFVSVGMLFDPLILIDQPLAVLGTLAIIIFGKSLVAFFLVRMFGHSPRTALTIAASLAQIGEFAFILAGLGMALNLLPQAGQNLVLAGAILSIMLNPVLFALLEKYLDKTETLEEQTLEEAKSVVFIDLDGFKDVNDIYGHEVGDELIITIARTLRDNVPKDGMLARMGGDEFAMTIGGDDAEALASAFAGFVLDYLNSAIRVGERTIHIGASIGIASGSLVECSSSELFRRADIAMYHSKITGKGRVTHYDAELNSERERQLAIESQIRIGLEKEEFDVWYQPIIDARSQKMVGVEALVRWPRRPEGPLGPDVFISIAETSGLIYGLGQFVLRRACQDLEPYGDLKLSVNISPAQFRDPEFETKVASVLEMTRFPAQRLQLEVTETYVLENPERARGAINNLKALGTAIALDDFGTGYSSIGYLRRFNFDTIKIDKSLAGLVDTDEQASALVSGTIRIASALGMTVIAEGVENEKQMKLLRLAGCDQLQGFWYSQPMPVDSIMQLRQQRHC
jgi:diguanylate cyclase (GGDEF)-like protein